MYRCPGGPNITSLRGVRPRWACEPGSAGPSYASTSVIRTLTPACVNVAPSSRGATSSTGRCQHLGQRLHRTIVPVGPLPARNGRRLDRRMPTPPRVADVFDALATTYDQTGMPFFRPVGARLVEQLAPQPGDRALDIGLAERSGPRRRPVRPLDDLLACVSPDLDAARRARVFSAPTPRARCSRAGGAEVQLSHGDVHDAPPVRGRRRLGALLAYDGAAARCGVACRTTTSPDCARRLPRSSTDRWCGRSGSGSPVGEQPSRQPNQAW